MPLIRDPHLSADRPTKPGRPRDTWRGSVPASPPSVAGGSRLAPRVRRRFWGAVAGLAVLTATLVALLQLSRRPAAIPPSAATPPPVSWPAGQRPAPDFRLADPYGRPVSLELLRGRVVIVTFIDPLCRNFCPLEAKQLNDVVRRLPAAQRPAIVAVSVNVYGNRRSNLLQDVAEWRLVPQWRWAVGSGTQLASVWRRYQIGVAVATKRIAGVTVHEISHTEAAYLVDGRGYERALFLWPFRAGDVRAALARLSP